MKTFITALFILALVAGFVIWNAVDLHHTFRELLTLTESLPMEAEEFHKTAENQATVETLYRLWDKKFSRIAMTGSYDNLTRADEAVGSLLVHYQNGNASDFTHARLMLWDSLRRLSLFESFHPEGIF